MHLLVTGGSGFIGFNFVKYWLERNPKDTVSVIDAFTYAAYPPSVDFFQENDVSFFKKDIRDDKEIKLVLQSQPFNCVVHFAAETHVDRSIQDPDAFLSSNVIGTHNLLKSVLEANRQTDHPIHFHHVSTDEVYGALQRGDRSFTEMSPYAPNSPYAASKASSDHLVRAYHKTYGLPVTVSHCSNNYGPFQSQDKLIPLVIKNILHGEPIPIYGDGNQIRDWLYVEDHCAAIELIVKDAQVGDRFNIGGEGEMTNLSLISLIAKMISEKNSKST